MQQPNSHTSSLIQKVPTNSSTDDYSHLNREEIKAARRIRKTLKKQQKREEKAREEALKRYEVTLDRSVTVVSRDFVHNVLQRSHQQTNASFKEYNANLNDFPSLNEQTFSKSVRKTISIPTASLCNNTLTTNTKSTYNIQIEDILNVKSKPIDRRIPEKHKDGNVYAGNILDASQPERKTGKHREIARAKRPKTFKKNILRDKEIATDVDNVCYKTYADHDITDDINKLATEFLQTIVKYQDNLYKRDPIKGKSKRRYYVGFHQVKKYLVLNKVKLLILAPDIRVIENGTLDLAIKEMIDICKNTSVPYVFALKRRILAKILKIHVPVSCIAINDYSALEALCEDIVQSANKTRFKTEPPEEEKLDSTAETIIDALKT